MRDKKGRGKDLGALAAGFQVWVQLVKVADREWKKATVVKEAGMRSYEIQDNNRVLIKNRRHQRETKQKKNNGDGYLLNKEPAEQQLNIDLQSNDSIAGPEPAVVSTESNFERSEGTVTCTRRSRISQKPKYLNDYYT